MPQIATREEIIDYYTQSNWIYKHLWYSKSLGMHCGFWDKETTSHDQALENQYKEIIRLGGITKNTKVLDAGCGVGGASLYIGQHTGAKVTAITITPLQVKECQAHIRRAQLENVHCLCADFTHTPFPDNSFDVVFGIESICHAYPKSEFLKEAKRILKKGGRLIISDGYCSRAPKNSTECQLVETFCQGWALSELITVKNMAAAIRTSGLKLIETINRTEQIKPTFQRVHQMISLLSPVVWLAERINLPILYSVLRNIRVFQASITGIDCGLLAYRTHVAEKI